MKLLSAVVAASLFALGLSGCGLSGSPEVRYKITVEVEDGGKLRSGSSVWSWTLIKPAMALATAYDGRFQGEAVAVELAERRTLFAILRGQGGGTGMAELLPERVFGDIGRSARGEKTRFSPDRIADLRDIASRTGEVATLDCRNHPDWCPMLVTFTDEHNPTSVARLEPSNLAAAFGPGVRLRRITVEVTTDDGSSQIENRLPWLERVGRERGTLIPNPPRLLKDASVVQLVSPSDFSTRLFR